MNSGRASVSGQPHACDLGRRGAQSIRPVSSIIPLFKTCIILDCCPRPARGKRRRIGYQPVIMQIPAGSLRRAHEEHQIMQCQSARARLTTTSFGRSTIDQAVANLQQALRALDLVILEPCHLVPHPIIVARAEIRNASMYLTKCDVDISRTTLGQAHHTDEQRLATGHIASGNKVAENLGHARRVNLPSRQTPRLAHDRPRRTQNGKTTSSQPRRSARTELPSISSLHASSSA